MRYAAAMTLDRAVVAAIRKALDDAQGGSAAEALPLLREASEKLTELIDDSMAEAVLADGASLRSAGARAGLSENAVGPRLARTAALGAYANDSGRVTAAAVERARYDRELGTPRTAAQPPKPMRFSPRRRTS
jgi:hypothetical protein